MFKMKFSVILAAMAAVAVVDTYPNDRNPTGPSPVNYYSTQHDDLDVDSMVKNHKLLKDITNCFLDKGPCNDLGAYYKGYLPEVTRTACAKCTPAQKTILRTYLEAVRTTFPEDFEALRKKYDPEGKYEKELRAGLQSARRPLSY